MNDFARVKEAVNLEEVITRETGFKMKRHHLEECPFCGGHDCFSIHDDEGYFKCFQCGDGKGDVFCFLEKYHKIDRKEALKKAAEIAGIELEHISSPAVRYTVKDKIFLETAKYYHENMLRNGVKNYLSEKRGHKIEVLKKMQVGYSTGDLLDHLRSKGFSDSDILNSGLATERKINDQPHIFDFFTKGLIIYPHIVKGKIFHFTMKDPKKEKSYQLPADKRHKQWRFYNQDALDTYEEIILLEGENDLQSVLDAGVNHVIGLIGQVSQEQIKSLGARCRKKTLYLWMDNDPPNDKGKRPGHEYIRKICQGLGNINIKIILYPDNQDPDEYLQNFKGDRRKEIHRLIDEAVDYISWEIIQAGRNDSLEARLAALKENKVFQAITVQPEIKQQIYIEKIEALGFTKKAISEQLEDKLDLRRRINVYFTQLSSKSDADPNIIAGIIHQCLSKDGRFFFDRNNKVFLLYNNRIYEISSNRPFNALMQKHTTLLYTEQPGRSVWESLANEAYNSGRQIDLAKWAYTDRSTDTIYLNLNSPNNIILKLNKKEVQEIPNGLNEDNVLLQSSDSIKPFNYLPDCDVREGFRVIKNLIFDNLTCQREQSWFVICWIISGFMLDFTKSHALLKFAGATASGKTTAARLLSLLMFGDENVGETSAAAAFAEASQNPLLVIDNLESGDMNKAILKFLLMAATGGQKMKRTSGTESGTTKENPKALVVITAIEPFTKAELINRTWEIEFNKRFHSDDFIEDEVTREIIKKRDLILSSILKLISTEILPNLKHRKDYIVVLKKQYKGHAKDRMNEYLALLMLILDKVLEYIPYYSEDDFLFGVETGAKEIRHEWIEYQNSLAKENEVSSNDILKLFNGLVHEYLTAMKNIDLTAGYKDGYFGEVFCYAHPEYGIELVKTKPETLYDDDGDSYSQAVIEFVATSNMIVTALDKYCRNNGLMNPYSKASVFGARLKNDINLLNKGRWELITRDGIEPYFRKVKGERFLKFRHTLIR